jgi:hypothetical protein
MKITIYSIFLIFYLFTFKVAGQNVNWREYLSQLAEEEIENSVVIENMYEELLNLETNPLNLNTVKKEELESIPLLSSEEVNMIFDFLKHNRPVMTVYELRNVKKLSYRTIQLIIPFFYVGEEDSDSNREYKFSQHDIQIRFDKTLTPRAGYGSFSDSILERYPNRKYRGEDFYNSVRYSLKYREKIQMGITAEKDAGEPLLKQGYKKGYDHYGFHFIINNSGRLKTLAIGDYRISFGQGLILNNDFPGSKSWSIDNVARRTTGPKRHFSTTEYGFFRGGAAMFEFNNVSLTAFYSNRLIDTNISDSGEITSFKTDGLHRTPLEISKKKNTREQVIGTNINYRYNRFQTGISGVYHIYNKMYNPVLRDYNKYYLRDQSNLNASIDYSYQLPGFILAGETAIAKNGAVATINSLQYRPVTDISFTLLYRKYPITYNALHAQAFSEGSRVQNENGIFIATAFKPVKRLTVNSYLDLVRFPWKKYGVNGPSKAMDLYFKSSYTFSEHSYIEARYKFKMKEKNLDHPEQENKSVLPYTTNKIRLRYNHEYDSGWNLRTTVDFAQYTAKYQPSERGIMISQNIAYRGESPLKGDAYLAWFNTDTYNSRLYSYERNLLSTFYMPFFYGKGVRLALSAKYEITSSLTISAKAGYTNYFNRDVIGSGTELINGNSRTDIFTYIRWRF